MFFSDIIADVTGTAVAAAIVAVDHFDLHTIFLDSVRARIAPLWQIKGNIFYFYF